KKIIKIKINSAQSHMLNHKFDFDSGKVHLDYIKGYRDLNYNKDRELLLASIYKIALIDNNDRFKETINKLSVYYRKDEVIKTYSDAQAIKNNFHRMEVV
ncbi:hypothetical protein AB4131_20340, partial [Vibrio lentus]